MAGKQRDAGEVPYLATRPCDGVGVRVFQAFWHFELVQQASAVQCFHRERVEPAQSERKLLQRRVEMLCPFEYQNGTLRHSQFTGKKESYRARPGDEDVVSRWMWIVTQQEAPGMFLEHHSISVERHSIYVKIEAW